MSALPLLRFADAAALAYLTLNVSWAAATVDRVKQHGELAVGIDGPSNARAQQGRFDVAPSDFAVFAESKKP